MLKTDERNWGAINLGDDLDLQVHDVVIDNFEIRGWFRSGIVSPTNLHPDENSYLTIRNNTIRDVDDTGIDLWSWVWGASDGLDGWRGGNNILIQNNLIDGANSFGIHTPSRVTTIEGNTIRNIGLIANLNEAGMGCGKTGSEGTCTENGAGLRIYVDNPARSGYGFTVQYNRFENIALQRHSDLRAQQHVCQQFLRPQLPLQRRWRRDQHLRQQRPRHPDSEQHHHRHHRQHRWHASQFPRALWLWRLHRSELGQHHVVRQHHRQFYRARYLIPELDREHSKQHAVRQCH